MEPEELLEILAQIAATLNSKKSAIPSTEAAAAFLQCRTILDGLEEDTERDTIRALEDGEYAY